MPVVTMRVDVAAALAEQGRIVEQAIDVLLPLPEGHERRLMEAMRYATLGGGKRLRGFLVMEVAGLFGVNQACAARVAASVEMMHAYSLVHDDLPAMDDDDLRRGQPSTHRQFDEATAILAGDALQAGRSRSWPSPTPMPTRPPAATWCWRWGWPAARAGWREAR